MKKILLQEFLMPDITLEELCTIILIKIKENNKEIWLFWHNDFGNLTALTSPMYIDQNGN